MAKIARIPPANVSNDDRGKLQTLERDLKSVVFGQDEALDKLASAVKMARAGLGKVDKPIGSFLFSGPTGVGKTEAAKQLAYIMGIELIRFDMSEYMERHADFRNIIIVMTTNAGAESLNKSVIGFTGSREPGDESADIKRLFTPEFRNRLDATVSFKPLNEQVILRVVDKFLLVLEQQLAEKKVEVTFTDKLRKHLAKKGFDPLMGARPMQRLIQDTIRRALADELLFGRLTEGGRLTVDVDVKTDEKGVETSEIQLDIQPLPKKEGKAKPEPEEISSE